MDNRGTEGPAVVEPPGADMDVGAGRGRQRGANGRRIRRKTQAHGAGSRVSGGGWQVAGVGDIHVDGVPCRERRWGAGVTERCGDDDCY